MGAGRELHVGVGVGVGGWNKGNEGAVERKEDLLNATMRRWQCDSRIWQYNGMGVQSEGWSFAHVNVRNGR